MLRDEATAIDVEVVDSSGLLPNRRREPEPRAAGETATAALVPFIPDDGRCGSSPTATERTLDAIAAEYRTVSEKAVWARAALAAEAQRAHGESSLTQLARLVGLKRERLVEDAMLGRYFRRAEDRVVPASASAHLYALRIARRRVPEGASDEHVLATARVLLLQTPDCKTLKAINSVEKRAADPHAEPEAAPAEDAAERDRDAYEAVMDALNGVHAYLASDPTGERRQNVVNALKALLKQADSTRLAPAPTDDNGGDAHDEEADDAHDDADVDPDGDDPEEQDEDDARAVGDWSDEEEDDDPDYEPGD